MRVRDRKHIRLLCSCDRNNYGDLLFPIVTRAALTSILGPEDEYEFAQYGLARSNLSVYGALPSRGIRDLYNDAKSGDVVLLAGGENLRTDLVCHASHVAECLCVSQMGEVSPMAGLLAG